MDRFEIHPDHCFGALDFKSPNWQSRTPTQLVNEFDPMHPLPHFFSLRRTEGENSPSAVTEDRLLRSFPRTLDLGALQKQRKAEIEQQAINRIRSCVQEVKHWLVASQKSLRDVHSGLSTMIGELFTGPDGEPIQMLDQKYIDNFRESTKRTAPPVTQLFLNLTSPIDPMASEVKKKVQHIVDPFQKIRHVGREEGVGGLTILTADSLAKEMFAKPWRPSKVEFQNLQHAWQRILQRFRQAPIDLDKHSLDSLTRKMWAQMDGWGHFRVIVGSLAKGFGSLLAIVGIATALVDGGATLVGASLATSLPGLLGLTAGAAGLFITALQPEFLHSNTLPAIARLLQLSYDGFGLPRQIGTTGVQVKIGKQNYTLPNIATTPLEVVYQIGEFELWKETEGMAKLEVIMNDPDEFALQVVGAAKTLFGAGEISLQIEQIAQAMQGDCRRWRSSGIDTAPTIAIVGIGGLGKSWLSRCFLNEHVENAPLFDRIRSGQQAAQRTLEPIQFGKVDNSGIPVPTSRMLDLGRPYSVIDTPGVDDDLDRSVALLTESAMISAPIKLMVVSEAKIRSADYLKLIHAMRGSIIVPVVRFDSEDGTMSPSAATAATVSNEMVRWRTLVPEAKHLSETPIYMPTSGLDPKRVKASQELVRSGLTKTLSPLLAESALLKTAIATEIANRVEGARTEIGDLLSDFRDRVGFSHRTLEERTRQIPTQILQQMLGDDSLLRAGIRQRFRADWMERTSTIHFPYRSFCGLLSLTQGAWDRLILGLIGSVPSLALSLFQAAKNAFTSGQFREHMSISLKDRTETLLGDFIKPDFIFFYNSLRALQGGALADLNESTEARVNVTGIGELHASYNAAVSEAIVRFRAWGLFVFLGGLTATASFLFRKRSANPG